MEALPPKCQAVVLAENPSINFTAGVLKKAVDDKVFVDLQNVLFVTMDDTRSLLSIFLCGFSLVCKAGNGSLHSRISTLETMHFVCIFHPHFLKFKCHGGYVNPTIEEIPFASDSGLKWATHGQPFWGCEYYLTSPRGNLLTFLNSWYHGIHWLPFMIFFAYLLTTPSSIHPSILNRQHM